MKDKLISLEMKKLFEVDKLTMEEIGRRYGIIKQAVQARLAKLGVGRRPNKYTLIDKHLLEKNYSDNSLSIDKIAKKMNVSKHSIESALIFYKIQKRPPVKSGGKYVDLLRDLMVGQKMEITLTVKNPLQVLHRSATATGIKIATRSRGNGKYMIIRIE